MSRAATVAGASNSRRPHPATSPVCGAHWKPSIDSLSLSKGSWTFPTYSLALPMGWDPFFLCPATLPSQPLALVLKQSLCTGEVTKLCLGWGHREEGLTS